MSVRRAAGAGARAMAIPALVGAILATGGLSAHAGHLHGSPSRTDAVLVGAGDIAECGTPGAAETAALLVHIPGTVFTAGDDAYPKGSAANFAQCYAPTWGRFKARTRPAAGNQEYDTRGAAPYYRYFGAAAGPAGKGYYSYTLGAWHVVVLNAECSEVACDRGSAQERWLRRDLAARPARCTLAIWHQPRFSSGKGDDDKTYVPFWDDLYAAGADVVINGHVHDYERFAPQDPKGHADPRRGIREFIVGTGGAHLRQKRRDVDANSQVLHLGTWGVLKLTLAPTSYRWQFIPVKGQTFTDAGSASCH